MKKKGNNIIRRGKLLAFLLRHDKDYPFDEHGWREIGDLITNHGYTMDELKEIVETNNKQRYEFSEDMDRIRARQVLDWYRFQQVKWYFEDHPEELTDERRGKLDQLKSNGYDEKFLEICNNILKELEDNAN